MNTALLKRITDPIQIEGIKKEPPMISIDAKHIFLDIVNYTVNRSVEAQTEIISVLNQIVRESVKGKLSKADIVYIPTGDGICISIINVLAPFDIHIETALKILEKLSIHNAGTTDPMRKFSVRIALNENIDNLIIDINGHKNISGSGINYASRILSLCDGNQILLGDSVYTKLVQREQYMKSFASYTAQVKHIAALQVHQYINHNYSYLNNNTPKLFLPQSEQKFSNLVGYYVAHCIRNETFNDEYIGRSSLAHYCLIVLTFFLAKDSLEKSQENKSDPGIDELSRIQNPIAEEIEKMLLIKGWIMIDLSNFIIAENLMRFEKYFKDGYVYLNEAGIAKLKQDCPAIYAEFEIGNSIAG